MDGKKKMNEFTFLRIMKEHHDRVESDRSQAGGPELVALARW